MNESLNETFDVANNTVLMTKGKRKQLQTDFTSTLCHGETEIIATLCSYQDFVCFRHEYEAQVKINKG